MNADAEKARLEQPRRRQAHWKKWGPHPSERQWGTVREDQTGGSGCVARIIQAHALPTPQLLLAPGAEAAIFNAMQARPAKR